MTSLETNSVLTHFSDPKVLQQIAPDRLLRFVDPFRAHIPISALSLLSSLGSGQPDFSAVAAFFAHPGLPQFLLTAVHALDRLASPLNADLLAQSFAAHLPHLALPADAPALARTLELWFHSSDLVLELAAKSNHSSPPNTNLPSSVGDAVIDASACSPEISELPEQKQSHPPNLECTPSIVQPSRQTHHIQLKRFTDPCLLGRFGLNRIETFLKHFENDFANAGVPIPRPPEYNCRLDALGKLFGSPALPHRVAAALLAIEKFAEKENEPLLRGFAEGAGFINSVPFEREVWALELWMRSPFDVDYVRTLTAHLPPSVFAEPDPAPSAPAENNATPEDDNNTLSPRELSQCPRNKIAHLPRETREAINLMMLQAVPSKQIQQRLGEAGKHINRSNLSRWKRGPFQEWLKDYKRMEQTRSQLKFALNVVRQNQNNDIHEAVQQIAALRISELFTHLDHEVLLQAFRDDPNAIVRLGHLLTKLSQGGLACERQRLEVTERQIELDKQKHPPKKGLSPEALKIIKEELKLM